MEVEDDAQADERVLLVFALERTHREVQQLLVIWTQDLIVWQPVEYLEHHVAQLVLGVVRYLRRRRLEQLLEHRQEALEEVLIFGRVNDFYRVPDLRRQLQLFLDA